MVLIALLAVMVVGYAAGGEPPEAATLATPTPALTAPEAIPSATPAPLPSTTPLRPRPWTVATSQPTGPDVLDAATFAALDTGSCLAWLAPGNVSAVPCAGPHSAEVALRRDIGSDFADTPTQEQITALSSRICPGVRRAWTGDGADYVDAYLWRWDATAPGPVVRRFLCTVSLAGFRPFTGTLRGAGP